LVAHTALKTPTAVATFLTEHNLLFESRIDALAEELIGLSTDILHDARAQLTEYGHALNLIATTTVRAAEQRLAAAGAALHYRTALYLQQQRSRCQRATEEIARAPERQLRAATQALADQERQAQEAVRFYLNNRKNELALYELQVEAKNPERILQMGYAMVYAPDGGVLKSVEHLTPGDRLTLRLKDGRAETEVAKVIPAKKQRTKTKK
jgi:exodeoxyribonuclease VII large subunit